MIFVKVFLVACCASAAYAGGVTFCEPFKSTYNDFLQKFYEAVEKRKSMIIDDLFNFPFFVDAEKNETQATFKLYYDFFINSTARLSSIDVETVKLVALGKVKPIPYPLSCFPRVFDVVREYLNRTVTQTLNTALQTGNSTEPSPSSYWNCTLHTVQLQTILGERQNITTEEKLIFPEFVEFIEVIAQTQVQHQYEYLLAVFADTFKLSLSDAKHLISANFTDLSVFHRSSTTATTLAG